MFPNLAGSTEHTAYDFNADENAVKWKDLFIGALEKVQKQVHPSLTTRPDALSYIESFVIQMLSMLCAGQPHTVQEVEERVQKKVPHPIDQWAISDAQAATERSRNNKKTSQLVLPVDRVHQALVKDVLGYKIDHQVSVYIVAVLEYIAADILKLTGNYVKNIKHQEISLQDIKVAMCADKTLMDLFFPDDEDSLTVDLWTGDPSGTSQTYEEIVKDMILEENQYLRDLNMIIRVFREPFVRLYPRSKDLEVIFSNILDIHELTQNLLSSLEDTVEATEGHEMPSIGYCFEDLTETYEFDVYEKYADDILKENGRMRLNALLQNSDATVTLESLRRGFKDAVKYVLPRMLLTPVFHFLHYCDTLKTLLEKTQDEDDRQSLSQSHDMLSFRKAEIERQLATKNNIKRKPGLSRFHGGRASRDIVVSKMNDLQKSIDGWEGKDIGQSCNELLMEGPLQKFAGRRYTDRYVFLFDGLIILTKQNLKRISVTGPSAEYKLKEKFQMRKVDIVDREDAEDLKNAFEVQVRQHPPIVLVAKTSEEKNNWLGALFSLLTWSMLERLLDSKLKEEESKQPLKLPTPDQYRFAIEDSEENIVFEDAPERESPLIRGGTLLKLVERLTYHTYADPKFAKTFLTTYRTFCKPEELLDLLIERFEIPEPPMSSNAVAAPNDANSIDSMSDISLTLRDDLKRFRNEYSKPVQFRVLNVVRQWVDQHWHDFEWNQELLTKLNRFLGSVKGKAMKKWVESINKIISRKTTAGERQKQITFKTQPPPIEYHLARKLEDFDIMTLHPVEIARQLTLLEFDLYRAVKSSEMVGSVWMKKDKDTTSRNLLRIIQHSTKLTYWLEKCIVETENLEERVAVLSRIIEVMIVFQELNNFNGVIEISAAITSAPVHRLEHTFCELNPKLLRSFEEVQDLTSNHFKGIMEKLRSIDPPCVPFLGLYLTNILLTEEGNPDFLPKMPPGVINFSKRRKVAEITAEIQQYQNQPYCLTVEPTIRSYFENLNPLEEMESKEFEDYLYNKSLEIEPRNVQKPPKFEKKRDYPLKSPRLRAQQGGGRHTLPSTQSASAGGGGSMLNGMATSTSSLTSGFVSHASHSNIRQKPSNLPSISSSQTSVFHPQGAMASPDETSSVMDFDTSFYDATPPTPSTPVSSVAQEVNGDDDGSVFQSNLSYQSVTGSNLSLCSKCSSTSTLCQTSVDGFLPDNMPYSAPVHATVAAVASAAVSDNPPPLPPRMQRRESETSSPFVSPALPPLPPRDSRTHAHQSRSPPPLPPRGLQTQLHDNGMVFTYRRSIVPRSQNSDDLPQVPPRTYRHSAHVRQNSS